MTQPDKTHPTEVALDDSTPCRTSASQSRCASLDLSRLDGVSLLCCGQAPGPATLLERLRVSLGRLGSALAEDTPAPHSRSPGNHTASRQSVGAPAAEQHQPSSQEASRESKEASPQQQRRPSRPVSKYRGVSVRPDNEGLLRYRAPARIRDGKVHHSSFATGDALPVPALLPSLVRLMHAACV